MAQFQYVDTGGRTLNIDAPDAATALKTAPGIDPHSGVQMVTPTTRSLNLTAGNPVGVIQQGQSQSNSVANTAGDAASNFNTAVQAMLQKYQGMGTANFQKQGFDAQTAKDQAIMAPPPENLAGANPSLQDSVRSNQANAFNPTIQSANDSTQTFSEQLKGFGDTLSKAQTLIQTQQAAQAQAKKDAQDLVHEAIASGSDAVQSLMTSQPDVIKLAGYSPDTLKGVVTGLKKTEAEKSFTTYKSTTPSGTTPVSGGSSGGSGLNPTNVPTIVAPYYQVSSSGTPYVDASTLQGTASDKTKIINAAQSAGLKIITNKNQAADLSNIQDAFNKLDTIQGIFQNLAQPSWLARDLYGMGLTKFASVAESDPQRAAAGSLQSIGLDILKAISGIQGFRGNQTAIQQVTDHLPSIYDTVDVVNQKIEYVRNLIQDREDGLLGKGQGNSPAASGSTGGSAGASYKGITLPN